MNYPTIQDDEWVTPIRKGYTMICCNCNLKHKVDFKINKRNQIQFKARRITK